MTDSDLVPDSNRGQWLDRKVFGLPYEHVICIAIIILAVVTRTADIGVRSTSHDESLHTSYSWDLYDGRGYDHNPMTHGPFLFHATALSFTLFGDSDATARLPVAVMGIALVLMPYLFRRWLGRGGAIGASILLLISPSIMYYSRYIRHDIPINLWSLVLVWAMFSYLRERNGKYLMWFAGALSLMFATKEVAFLYVAVFGSFIAIRLIAKLYKNRWMKPQLRNVFSLGLIVMVAGILFIGSGFIAQKSIEKGEASQIDIDPVPLETESDSTSEPAFVRILMYGGVVFLVGGLTTSVYSAIRGNQPERQRNRLLEIPEFDIVVLFSTLLLPFFSSLPLVWMGRDPTDYSTTGLITAAVVLVTMLLITVAVGTWWNWRRWLSIAGVFYIIFIVLFTTFFTNGRGVATGWVGSLGYWLKQQAVERGSQPWYFYLWVVPLYELLPMIGALGGVFAWFIASIGKSRRDSIDSPDDEQSRVIPSWFGFAGFLVWWVAATWAVYSYAGEKMGWLTVHFAVPMILLTGWMLNQLLSKFSVSEMLQKKGWLSLVLVPIGIGAAIRGIVNPLIDGLPLLADQRLESLTTVGRMLGALVVLAIVIVGLWIVLRKRSNKQVAALLLTPIALLFTVYTFRVAYMTSFVNDETAKEFLVYAHSAQGTRVAVDQIEELSYRFTGSKEMRVSFGSDVQWPYWWYLRDYPNKHYFGENPTRDILESPVIVVGSKNWSKVEPLLGNRYIEFEYTFVQWPIEDYKGLTWERIWKAVRDPAMRSALWEIITDRDYREYALVTGRTIEPGKWPLRHQMKMYVRKDKVAQLWDYPTGSTAEIVDYVDPYEANFEYEKPLDAVYQSSGTVIDSLISPRDVATSDDQIYVVDWGNHRIVVFDSFGEVINVWGSYCDLETGEGCIDPDGSGPQPLGAGQFREPWGIGIGSDGTIYVADTWNHRVQHFSTKGDYLNSWGAFGTAASFGEQASPG
ncbi:MAG: flippase activity-associated protein Agl23, partial [Chloroflexota bacterium]